MTKAKYDEARILLDQINHIELLLNEISSSLGGQKNIDSLFSIYRNSNFIAHLKIGEISIMRNALTTELNRLYAEFEKV